MLFYSLPFTLVTLVIQDVQKYGVPYWHKVPTVFQSSEKFINWIIIYWVERRNIK
jgi:hypothetical protein